MSGKFGLIVAALLLGAQVASADVLWSNRYSGGVAAAVAIGNADGTAANAAFSNVSASDTTTAYPSVLEDGVFTGGAGAYSISGINIGYNNVGTSAANIDAVVQFYTTVNYNVSGTIPSGPVGSPYTLNFTAPGSTTSETGLLTLPGGPLSFPSNTFGVSIRFDTHGTSNYSPTFQYLFKNVPIAVGTSDGRFAADLNNDGVYTATSDASTTEVLRWDGGGFPEANLYMEIQGTAVPEPTSLGLIALAGLGALRRRR